MIDRDLVTAEKYAKRAQRQFAKAQADFLENLAVVQLGSIELARGQKQRAQSYFQSSLESLADSDDVVGQITVHNLIAMTKMQDDPQAATGHLQEALDLSTSLDNPFLEMQLSLQLGLLQYSGGNFHEASLVIANATELSEEVDVAQLAKSLDFNEALLSEIAQMPIDIGRNEILYYAAISETLGFESFRFGDFETAYRELRNAVFLYQILDMPISAELQQAVDALRYEAHSEP